MLSLSRGNYTGVVQHTANAGEILISTTEYFNNVQSSPLHYHENSHLSFVLRGNMLVKRNRTEYASESFSYMQAGEAHQNRVHSDHCKNINLELPASFFSRYNIPEPSIAMSGIMKQPASSLLMIRLYKELIIQDESFNESTHLLILSAIQRKDNMFTPSWVKQVRELLNDQWNEPVSLKQISEIIRIHPVTISKYFQRYFGAGFGEYRRRLKVERALAMMAHSKRSLTEISYECGFFDQSHFIKAFKENTRFLPAQYRNLCEQSAIK